MVNEGSATRKKKLYRLFVGPLRCAIGHEAKAIRSEHTLSLDVNTQAQVFCSCLDDVCFLHFGSRMQLPLTKSATVPNCVFFHWQA